MTMTDSDKDIAGLKSDMNNMVERWLRVEHKFDCILSAQNNINIKTNIVIGLQLITIILIGVM